MADDADIAGELLDREIASLLARHKARQPPPRPAAERTPTHLRQVMDSDREERER